MILFHILSLQLWVTTMVLFAVMEIKLFRPETIEICYLNTTIDSNCWNQSLNVPVSNTCVLPQCEMIITKMHWYDISFQNYKKKHLLMLHNLFYYFGTFVLYIIHQFTWHLHYKIRIIWSNSHLQDWGGEKGRNQSWIFALAAWVSLIYSPCHTDVVKQICSWCVLKGK